MLAVKRSNIKFKNAKTTKSLLAETPQQVDRFNSSEDQNMQILGAGAGMPVVLRTADFLVSIKGCL